ncbi:hypothetical protein REPUB_Repub03eG0210600 [Reevesia pubescens]
MEEDALGEPPPEAVSACRDKGEKTGHKRIRARMEDSVESDLGKSHDPAPHKGLESNKNMDSYKDRLMNASHIMESESKEEGKFEVVDMDHGYYCIRFGLRSDYNFVLTNGPWLIADHYLTIRRWTPEFRLEEATIDSVAAWIRFPGMPLKYYDNTILRCLGDEIGRSVRIDRTTSNMSRGKFARICVELDLNKPLVSKIFIGGRWQKIEYEGLKMLCFHCGRFGHSDLDCQIRRKKEKGYTEEQANRMSKSSKASDLEHENERFGPWMIAKINYRKSNVIKHDGSGKQTTNVASARGGHMEKDSNGPRFIEQDGSSKQTTNVGSARGGHMEQASNGSRFTVLGEEEDNMGDTEVIPNFLDFLCNKKDSSGPSNNQVQVEKRDKTALAPKHHTGSHTNDPLYLTGMRGDTCMTLVEPRISGVTANNRCKRFGYFDFFRVKAQGFAGGIWLFWNTVDVDIEILAFSSQLIHALVKILGKPVWLLTVVYGSPKVEERMLLWESLKLASSSHHLP